MDSSNSNSNPNPNDDFGYGAAIDAGSSGSRIYLYRWPKAKDKEDKEEKGHRSRRRLDASSSRASVSFARVEKEAIFSDEVSPGISSSSSSSDDNDDDGDGDDYSSRHVGMGLLMLGELVSRAMDALPPGVDPGNVPIYLGATAGMRMMADDDSNSNSAAREEAERIMSNVRTLLRESGFLFRDDNWARTISGEEEGVYDWLVANYLKNDGNFPMMPGKTTYGALDLGGASTQISFPVVVTSRREEDDGAQIYTESIPSPDRPDSFPPDQPGRSLWMSSGRKEEEEGARFPLRIDNVEYPLLYTRSFLYYGVDQARMKYDRQFASSPSKINPCYPSGYTDPETDVSGSSNWKECLESVARLFERAPNNCEEGERCSIGSAVNNQPPFREDQKFIAMSAFVYTWDYLGLEIEADTADLNEMNARAHRVCNLTHRQQLARYERRMESKPLNRRTIRPHAQCFNAAFSYHLLSKAYGMPLSKTPIEIYHDIDGTKVQWALGLMLVEANRRLGDGEGGGGSSSVFFGEGIGIGGEGGGGGQPQQRLDAMYGAVGGTYKNLLALSVAVLFLLTWVLGKRGSSTSADSKQCNGLPLVDDTCGAAIEKYSPRRRRSNED